VANTSKIVFLNGKKINTVRLMSLSKNQLKLITSLGQKKYRTKHQLFIAEGIKVVNELLNSTLCLHRLFCTEDLNFDVPRDQVQIISEAELKRISSLKTPNKILGVFEIPEPSLIDTSQLILALDAINDPGNLGTIIRLCDWFGIEHLLCSKDTVDAYNQKVVQASMGSLTRVNLHYVDLNESLKNLNVPIYCTQMNGENIYSSELSEKGVLVMGNEANGISDAILQLADRKIAIPQFGDVQKTESLNVATATAVCLSEFKRKS
tara:strand:- start:87170 stop:87961 length:792 start_codon:yes stop_codon:yes gene_type:complete